MAIGGHCTGSFSWGTAETWCRNDYSVSYPDGMTIDITVSGDVTSGNSYYGGSYHRISGYGTTCQVGAAEYNGTAASWHSTSGTYNYNAKVAGISHTYRYTRGYSAGTMSVWTKYWGSGMSGELFQTVSIPARESHTVSYNANGGSGAPGSQTKWYGDILTLSTTKPTRTGYTFKTWFAPNVSDSRNYAPGEKYGLDENVTMTAQWTENTWTVSFNANGGSGAPGNQTKYYTKNLTLSSTKPTRTNYVFLGWSTNKNATSATYAAGGTFSTNANTTLYAIWKLNAYDVTYNNNGGSGTPTAQKKIHDTALTLQSSGCTKTGFTLSKWNTKADGTGTDYALGGSYTANAALTLYAQWTRNSYTLSFNSNGGNDDAPADIPDILYEGSTTIPTETPTRAKYLFAGWSKSASGTVDYAAGTEFSPMPAGNTTLYAVWTSAYTTPKIRSASAVRCDYDGATNDEGEYCKVVFSWSTSSTTDSEGKTYPVANAGAYAKMDSQDPYYDPEATGEEYAGTYTHIFGDATVDTSHTISISVTDVSGVSASTTLTISSTHYWIDVSPEYGMCFGGGIAPDESKAVFKQDEFEVEGNATFDADATVGGDLAVSGTGTFEGKVIVPNMASGKGGIYPEGYETGAVEPAYIYASAGTGSSSTKWRWVFTSTGNIRAEVSTNGGSTWTSKYWYLRSVLEQIYPVGAVYISYVSTSPASLFGGSWTQITGRFLRAANDVSTGGSDSYNMNSDVTPIKRSGYEASGYGLTQTAAFKDRIIITGSTTTFNNMPAYQDLYVWRRTA